MVRKNTNLDKSVDVKLRLFRKEKPTFDSSLKKIAKSTTSQAVIVPLKQKKKIIDKTIVDYKGDLDKVKDILRGSIVISNLKVLDSVLFHIKKYFKIIKIKDRFKKPGSDEYRDMLLHLDLNGKPCEIQIHLEEPLKVKLYVGHELYSLRSKILDSAEKHKRELFTWEEQLINKILDIEKYANEQAFIRQKAEEKGIDKEKLIFFISNNALKNKEFKKFIPNLKWMKINLPEIESKSHNDVIKTKLRSALNYVDGNVMVEDIGLYCDGLVGLPGPMGIPHPFHRYYDRKVTPESFAKLVIGTGNVDAKMVSTIGFSSDNEIYLFEGITEGKIVLPRGSMGHDWDCIFQPNGSDKTFAEMSSVEKEQFSMRIKAMRKMIEKVDELL